MITIISIFYTDEGLYESLFSQNNSGKLEYHANAIIFFIYFDRIVGNSTTFVCIDATSTEFKHALNVTGPVYNGSCILTGLLV